MVGAAPALDAASLVTGGRWALIEMQSRKWLGPLTWVWIGSTNKTKKLLTVYLLPANRCGQNYSSPSPSVSTKHSRTKVPTLLPSASSQFLRERTPQKKSITSHRLRCELTKPRGSSKRQQGSNRLPKPAQAHSITSPTALIGSRHQTSQRQTCEKQALPRLTTHIQPPIAAIERNGASVVLFIAFPVAASSDVQMWGGWKYDCSERELNGN